MEARFVIVGCVVSFMLLTVSCAGRRVLRPQGRIVSEPWSRYQVETPVIGTDPEGRAVRLGGFSGLHFSGKNIRSGNSEFLALTNRGPTLEKKGSSEGRRERSFLVPDFRPRLVHLELDEKTGRAAIVGETILMGWDESPLTGLPNRYPGRLLPYADEVAVDVQGERLEPDPIGADFGGVVQIRDGSVWLADKYGPSLFHFSGDGKLIERIVPEGSGLPGTEALPGVYNYRREEGGFEALAEDRDRLVAFFRRPLGQSSKVRESRLVRILEFIASNNRVVGEYVYELEDGGKNWIGDAVGLGNRRFLVVERGEDKFLRLYRIELQPEMNVVHMKLSRKEKPLMEEKSLSRLEGLGVRPVSKVLVMDMLAEGYQFSMELDAISLVDHRTLAFINNDGFGVGRGEGQLTELVLGRFEPERVSGGYPIVQPTDRQSARRGMLP